MKFQLFVAALAGLLLAFTGSTASARQPKAESSATRAPCPPKAADDKDTTCIVFKLASDVVPSSSAQLYNGYRVKGTDWPALALAAFDYVDNLGRPATYTCTATLLGPRVLLTAAHCVDMGKKSQFRTAHLIAGERTIKVYCDPDPRYFESDPNGLAPRNSYDFALCELSWQGATTPVPLTKITFETIDVTTPLKRQDPVVMVGYGCANMSVEDHSRIVFVTDLKMLRAAGETIELGVGEEKGTPATVRTRSPKGKEPALCKGDSGGPMLSGIIVVPPDAADGLASIQRVGLRRVRGVNSSVDFDENTAAPEDFLSRVVALQGTGFQTYVAWWRGRHTSAQICGWDKDMRPCEED
jgi:hypothetical protein